VDGRHADEIIVLEAGRIVERGTHRSLLAAGGAYADLVAEQTTGTRRRPDPLGPASVGTSNRSAQ
jgi:ABC-type transport system involved in cytochrome bd biosynthesis fused ATPase/permease subunit